MVLAFIYFYHRFVEFESLGSLTHKSQTQWLTSTLSCITPYQIKDLCSYVCKKFFINYGKWLQQSRNVHYAALKTFKLLWFPTLNRCVHLDPTRGLTVSCALLATRCHTGDCHPKQFSRIVPDRLPWPKIAFFFGDLGGFLIMPSKYGRCQMKNFNIAIWLPHHWKYLPSFREVRQKQTT